MNNKLLDYIENSFLAPLLKNENVTDISFNGEYLFYENIKEGRKRASINLTLDDASTFIRQIANLSEQMFSFTTPSLDVSVGRYRINAMHSAIVRVNNEKSISFSIRISSKNLKILNDENFMSKECKNFLGALIKGGVSVVIAGITGSGKTELQKFLLHLTPENSRIIIIDNVAELDSIRLSSKSDITTWLVSDKNEYSSFEYLIKNAVRNNPDWLVVAEARGKEMSSVLNSAMTGHPIITTVHAKDVTSVPHRMARLVLIGDKSATYDEVLDDIKYHFPVYVYLKKVNVEGKIIRYIDSIAEIWNQDNKMHFIYTKSTGFIYSEISPFLRKELNLSKEILDV